MNVRFALAALAMLVASLSAGCVSFRVRTPDGFARLPNPRPGYDYRAMSAYGVAVAVRAVPNQGGATLGFWSEAVDRALLRQGTYRSAGSQEVRTTQGLIGRNLRYTAGDPQNGGTYWVTVYVTRDWVYLVEAGGSSSAFARAQPEVERTLQVFEGA